MADTQENLKHLKELITKLRNLGKSYEELGAKAGVSSTTILRIDKGETRPKDATVEKVTTALEGLLSTERESLMEGYASPFNSFSDEELASANELAQEIKIQLEVLLNDDNLPERSKQRILKILETTITNLIQIARHKKDEK